MSRPLSETELDALVARSMVESEQARREVEVANMVRRLVAEVRTLRDRDAAWKRSFGCADPPEVKS